MKAQRQNPISLFADMVLERRRFVCLLAALTAAVPFLPRVLSKFPGRRLSLHEAEFYRRSESKD